MLKGIRLGMFAIILTSFLVSACTGLTPTKPTVEKMDYLAYDDNFDEDTTDQFPLYHQKQNLVLPLTLGAE